MAESSEPEPRGKCTLGDRREFGAGSLPDSRVDNRLVINAANESLLLLRANSCNRTGIKVLPVHASRNFRAACAWATAGCSGAQRGTGNATSRLFTVETDTKNHRREHQHAVFHAICVCEGAGTFAVDGQNVGVRHGDIVLVSPGVSHLFACFPGERLIYHEFTFTVDTETPIETWDQLGAAYSGDEKQAGNAHALVYDPTQDDRGVVADRDDGDGVRPLRARGNDAISDGVRPTRSHRDSRAQVNEERRRVVRWKRFQVDVDTCVFFGSLVRRLTLSFLGTCGATDPTPLVQCLLANICFVEPIDSPTEQIDSLHKSRLYIEYHYQEPLRLKQLAGVAGVSEKHFCRVFARRFGRSPIAMKADLQMANAERLLASTRYAIKAIAGAVGYEDVSHFSKNFRKRHGISPSAFRERFASIADTVGGDASEYA